MSLDLRVETATDLEPPPQDGIAVRKVVPLRSRDPHRGLTIEWRRR
jgi:hypothetical protein